MRKSLLFSIITLFVVEIEAQNKLSAYSQHFIAQQEEVSTTEQMSKIKSTFNLNDYAEATYVRAYIHFDPEVDLAAVEELGVKINARYNGIATTQIPTDRVEQVANLEIVNYVEVATPVYTRMDVAREMSYIDEVHQGVDIVTPYLGKDVVIGIIDMGFQYTHSNFLDEDSVTLRIKRVWDQNVYNGVAPQGYDYGEEYVTQEAILADICDSQYQTHGTHVAGIAAGGNTSLGLQGAAPKADIVLVSLDSYDYSSDRVSLTDGIQYIYNYADSVGKPCVINMSLGAHVGPHDGTSTFDRICDELQGEGRLLVGSQGNEGDVPLHMAYTFNETDTVAKYLYTFISSSYKVGQTDIWGDPNTPYSLQAILINKRTGEVITESDVIDAAVEGKQTVYFRDNSSGNVSFTTSQDPTTEKYNTYVYINFSSIDYGYSLGLVVTANEGSVHGWCDGQYLEFADIPVDDTWSIGDTSYTMGEIGGTGSRIISVGAYTSKTKFENLSGMVGSVSGVVGDIATFSSHGPTADNRMKPDIAAPGNCVISSYNAYMYDTYSLYLTHSDTITGSVNYYGMMSGTSMSSPLVAGVLATWLEVNPQLTPEDVRAIFSRSATKDDYTGDAVDNIFGYGKINAWEGIKQLITTSGEDETLGDNVTEVVLYKQSDNQLELFFAQQTDGVQISLYTMSGALLSNRYVEQVALGSSEYVELEGLVSGIYIVLVATSESVETIKVVVK